MQNEIYLKYGKEAIVPEYFPTVMQAFIFRNWNMVEKGRIAKVLGTDVKNVETEAYRMGLDVQGDVSAWITKGYITILRSNWHLLPYEQLLELLDWDAARLNQALKEDDFLDIKLGNFKPLCERITYKALTEEEKKQTEKIFSAVKEAQNSVSFVKEPFDFCNKNIDVKKCKNAADGQIVIDDNWYIDDKTDDRFVSMMVERYIKYFKNKWGIDLYKCGEKPIELILIPDKKEEYHEIIIEDECIKILAGGSAGIQRALYRLDDIAEANEGTFFDKAHYVREPRFESRYIFSFCALYDSALETDSRIWCSDSLLEQYAQTGVNGIWLQGLLYRLTEFPYAPEMSKGWQERLKNLADFVERAKSYGIRVYLYLNEPRAMPHSFYEKYPDLKGSMHNHYTCMCVNNSITQEYIKDAVEKLCRAVPELGGFFTITMSENPTHCLSRPGEFSEYCHTCKNVPAWTLVSKVNSLITEGVRRVSDSIQVIAWNWDWNDAWGVPFEDVEKLIKEMPKDVAILCQRDEEIPFSRGGVDTKVNEYSLSVDGISDITKRTWELAKKYGHKTAVKLQINNTWECSTTPYLPVYQTLINHMNSLIETDVNHLMLSWTLGGYPSPSIKLISESFFIENGRKEPDYEFILKSLYKDDADKVKAATDLFCEAFSEFPFDQDVLYYGPHNNGVSNILYSKPTGYEATMTCFPYDDIEKWKSIYTLDILENQYKKVSDLWKNGLLKLDSIEGEIKDIAIVSYSLFRSSYNQLRFVRLRDSVSNSDDKQTLQELLEVIKSEKELAKEIYPIMRRIPEVGFEAANHYFYTADAVLEKIINCEYLEEYFNKQI